MNCEHEYRKLNEEEYGKEVFECVKCGFIKGQENLDYCDNCEKYINQIDLGDGSYGCPLCKRDDCITTFYQGDEKWK